MYNNYMEMLQQVKMRKAFINMSSLEDKWLNAEWQEIIILENSLHKLLKIIGQQNKDV